MTTQIPFAFNWFYKSETINEIFSDVLFIEEPSLVKPLHLIISNNLVGKEITLPPSTSTDPITSGDYHFKLKFNPGVLNTPGGIQVTNQDWEIGYAPESGGAEDVVYLRFKGENPIILAQDNAIELIFNGVAAKDTSATKSTVETVSTGTRVVLNWILNSLQIPSSTEGEEYQGQQETIAITPFRLGGEDYGDTQTLNLEKVKTKGKVNIPLYVGFTGSNRVLNINNQESALQLRITNIAEDSSAITFHYDSDENKRSQLVVSLEVGDATTVPWALGTQDDVNGITVSTTDSNWQSQGPNPLTIGDVVRALQWTFTPSSVDVHLGAQETLKIDISKIKTSHPTGATKLYLGYKYVPEYQDGEFIYAIEKAPLVFDDYKVGIGTSKPAESLHITGGGLRIDERFKDKTGYVMPVGSILPYAGSKAPDGWLFCDGQEYSSSEYQDLFDVIGTQYGGDESTFQVPNLQGRVLAGLDTDQTEFGELGKIGGSNTHQLSIDEMPIHNHGARDVGHSHQIPHYTAGNGNSWLVPVPANLKQSNYSSENGSANIVVENTGRGQDHNNLQPYITVNYIIKY